MCITSTSTATAVQPRRVLGPHFKITDMHDIMHGPDGKKWDAAVAAPRVAKMITELSKGVGRGTGTRGVKRRSYQCTSICAIERHAKMIECNLISGQIMAVLDTIRFLVMSKMREENDKQTCNATQASVATSPSNRLRVSAAVSASDRICNLLIVEVRTCPESRSSVAGSENGAKL